MLRRLPENKQQPSERGEGPSAEYAFDLFSASRYKRLRKLMAQQASSINIPALWRNACNWVRGRMQARRPARMQAVNLTRNTVLADDLHATFTGAERRKGLLGRDGLHPGEGMWILPSQAVHTFFMRFPIDLVYIDRKHRVRKLRATVPPGRISVCFFASSVLELPVGVIQATHTQKGDQLEIGPYRSPLVD
jgi:uncharacterized membrane protein (UPF0127 family)